MNDNKVLRFTIAIQPAVCKEKASKHAKNAWSEPNWR